MFRGLVICAVACASAFPALAGDKPARLNPGARALTDNPMSYGAPGAKTVAAPAHARFGEGPPVTGYVRLSSTAMPQPRRLAATDPAALPNWRITEERDATTAEAGGSYAVRDYFSSERKPRFRRSALGALLVLKIDGQEDSPPLSVGGGGVAAAVWQVVPK